MSAAHASWMYLLKSHKNKRTKKKQIFSVSNFKNWKHTARDCCDYTLHAAKGTTPDVWERLFDVRFFFFDFAIALIFKKHSFTFFSFGIKKKGIAHFFLKEHQHGHGILDRDSHEPACCNLSTWNLEILVYQIEMGFEWTKKTKNLEQGFPVALFYIFFLRVSQETEVRYPSQVAGLTIHYSIFLVMSAECLIPLFQTAHKDKTRNFIFMSVIKRTTYHMARFAIVLGVDPCISFHAATNVALYCVSSHIYHCVSA